MNLYEWNYPTWQQIVERFPLLWSLEAASGPDLCARCFVGGSGFLGDCELAGATAANPEVQEGVKVITSLIRITRRDGRSAAGHHIGLPINFGRWVPPPVGGYCSNPHSDFLPL
ncbi:MAG TPA: hypothetical protein VGO55_05325 [Allosphingosinicella sp.]|jgi:hypothetical protein|nr:hypothetical protein [Allosphingosinicella sp.]